LRPVVRAEPRFRALPLEAATLLSEGKVIEAIKVVRNTEGAGHREARARVDAHIAQDPILRVQIETQRQARRRKFARRSASASLPRRRVHQTTRPVPASRTGVTPASA
jgi:hypothetical protein